MKYRIMGRSGLKLSEISLGAWLTFGDQIEDKTANEVLHAAYDQGVNFFDNADVYASGRAESVMGKAIADLPGRRWCSRARCSGRPCRASTDAAYPASTSSSHATPR